MADFPSVVVLTEAPDVVLGDEGPSIALAATDVASIPPPTEYLQRIYDTGLAAYVYFTRQSTNPASPPIAPGDTQPNNTGSLDLTNHAILAEV